MKRIIPLTVFLLTILLSGCVRESGDEQEGADISVGDKLPALSLTMADGSKLTSEQLNGKVSVIILFTTTCGDCRKQLPVVDELFRLYSNDQRITMLGISRSESDESIREFWQEEEMILPYSPQEDRTVYNLFAASGVPRIYLSDESMVVRLIYTDSSFVPFDELNKAVESLLN